MLGATTSSGWRFVVPVEGLQLIERASGRTWRRTATGWEIGRVQASELLIDGVKVVGSRSAAVANPLGGATIDTEARASLASVLATLRTHCLIGT